MKQKSISLYDWCITNNREDLLKEWDYVYNVDKNPSSITFGSNACVAWICHANVNHFFHRYGKQFFQEYGKEFFQTYGKQNFQG